MNARMLAQQSMQVDTSKVNLTYSQIDVYLDIIHKKILLDFLWKPDVIIGISRGGLVPAVHLSHRLNIPMRSLNVSLRDSKTNEPFDHKAYGERNILFVDDINDSGSTLDIIRRVNSLDEIWGSKIRTAVLLDKATSKFHVDYSGVEIPESMCDLWWNFPWEYDRG